MTEAMYYLLLALRTPAHGYRLMQAVSEISHGRVHMGPGTLYGLIAKLLEEGIITLSEQDTRRKIYALTSQGEAALRAEYSRLQAMVLDGLALKNPVQPDTFSAEELRQLHRGEAPAFHSKF